MRTKVTQHRAKCDRFGCQFRPISATKSKIFDWKVGQNSQRSAHKHSTSVKKKYSWIRKSNFHDQKSVRIYTIKDSKMSFSCPKFILTIHLVVGVFSLWLLIGQPQLHTKWFIYWQVTLCEVWGHIGSPKVHGWFCTLWWVEQLYAVSPVQAIPGLSSWLWHWQYWCSCYNTSWQHISGYLAVYALLLRM